MKRRKGLVSWSVSLFVFVVMFLLIMCSLQLQEYDAVKIFTEDALAASNLASAVIDLEEYGINHNIVIKNPDAAYEIYRDAMKINMKLDNAWESSNETISGLVEVLDYIVYNVRDTDIDVYSYGINPYHMHFADGVGNVAAPNGELIESTSIYSRITFPVNGILGVQTVSIKDELVDIVNLDY